MVTMHWGRRNNETLWGLWDTESELAVIPKKIKCHCGSPVRVGEYEGQMMEFWFSSLP